MLCLARISVEISRSNQNPTDPIIKSIGRLGIDLLGLVGNEYLFAQDIEQHIDRIFAAYPEIRYFQIGNEVTTILPSTGPTITIDDYMIVFQRIYNHVRNHHPGRAVLLTQSTLGYGVYGPAELEAMVRLGLARLCARKSTAGFMSTPSRNLVRLLVLPGLCVFPPLLLYC